jgi:hypothetical protein
MKIGKVQINELELFIIAVTIIVVAGLIAVIFE